MSETNQVVTVTDWAHRTRLALVNAGLYPTGDLADDPGADVTMRKALQGELYELISQLNLTDLKAICDVAGWLVPAPPTSGFWEYVGLRVRRIERLAMKMVSAESGGEGGKCNGDPVQK